MKPIATLIRLAILFGIPIVVAIFTYRFVNQTFLEPLEPGSSKVQLVEIPPGKSFREICTALEDQGIVRHWWGLDLIARFQKNDGRVNAGEYELSPGMTPGEILRKLVTGDVLQRFITVREGETIWSIGNLLEEAGILVQENFDPALTDPSFLALAGIQAKSFEGYLFPETYAFSRPITPKAVIFRMLREGEKHWLPNYNDRAFELGLSRHEIIILASIIEKESGNVEEQPVISSVFHNRLSKGMKLQADPTVIYGIPDFKGALRKKDLETPSAYNTYTQFGLPEGPICNPGETAIKAALFPADTPYLFFVATGKGGHTFSATLKEHNTAVNQYRRNLEEKKRQMAVEPTEEGSENPPEDL